MSNKEGEIVTEEEEKKDQEWVDGEEKLEPQYS